MSALARRTANLRVFLWGDGKLGCLGGRGIRDRKADDPISFSIPNACGVTAGWAHSGILSEDGKFFALGRTHDIQNCLRVARMWKLTAAGIRVWNSIDCPEPRYVVPPEAHMPQNDPIVSGDTSACLTAITTESGRTFLYGDNRHGQCGNGDPCDRVWDPTELVGVREGDRMSGVALGFQHGLGLTHSGSVYAWGKGDRGQLGIGGAQSNAVATVLPAFDQERQPPEVLRLPADVQDRVDVQKRRIEQTEVPKLQPNKDFIDVQESGDGGEHISSDSADEHDNSLPAAIDDAAKKPNHTDFRLEHKSHRATKIGCGLNHSAAMSNEGKMFLWGKFCSIVENDEGNAYNDQFVPRQATLKSPVIDFACGQYHTTCLTADGSLWVMGMQSANLARQRALDPDSSYKYDTLSRFINEPEEVEFQGSFEDAEEEIVKIVAGWGTNAVITNRGHVYTYVWNEPPKLMQELKDYFVVDIAFGWKHNIMVGERRA
jgi:alpha-tubulin suppressor-like RCC1 family protein